MCFAPKRRALFRHLNFQKWSQNGVFHTFLLQNLLPSATTCTFSIWQLPKVLREWCVCTCSLPHVLRATTAYTCSTSQLPKVVRTRRVLTLFTSRCVSRHNGVHFFDVSTSKSAPKLRCFAHVDFKKCFSPQRRALPDISTSKSVPKLTCFVHFDFKTCFAPQRCAIFHPSSGQLAPHPPLKRAYFSTFRSHKSLENTVFGDFPAFSRTCIFSLLTFFTSEFLPGSAFSWLCFSSAHIVGTLVSGLPSITCILYIAHVCFLCVGGRGNYFILLYAILSHPILSIYISVLIYVPLSPHSSIYSHPFPFLCALIHSYPFLSIHVHSFPFSSCLICFNSACVINLPNLP